MKEYRYKDPEKNGEYIVFDMGGCEVANPIEYYRAGYIQKNASMYRVIYLAKEREFKEMGADLGIIEQEIMFRKRAISDWEEWFLEKSKTPINPNYLALLETGSKKEQVKLLKGLGISTYELFALIINAYTDYNLKFSQYRFEHSQKGVDEKELTDFTYVTKKGKVITSRESMLSDAQLRQAVEHRVVTVVKFLENDTEWHCFFTNFKSLGGKEISYKNGQPHYHYISDKWGLSKQQLIDQLSSRKYSLPSMPHLDYTR